MSNGECSVSSPTHPVPWRFHPFQRNGNPKAGEAFGTIQVFAAIFCGCAAVGKAAFPPFFVANFSLPWCERVFLRSNFWQLKLELENIFWLEFPKIRDWVEKIWCGRMTRVASLFFIVHAGSRMKFFPSFWPVLLWVHYTFGHVPQLLQYFCSSTLM